VNSLPKLIMTIGVVLIMVGFVMQFVKLGRLPGDIVIRKGNMTFYFPVVTSILLSVVLSLIFYVLGRFR
jgi:predicted tellurium resistance membrane protein TerC